MKTIGVARWAALAALFVIPFLGLVVDRSLWFPYVAGRNFAFRVLVEIATAGWLILALNDRAYRPRLSTIAAVFGLFVVWMGIADAFAINPHKAFWGTLERMDGWISLLHLLAFFVVAGAVLGRERLWPRWWLTFVGASSLTCAYGMLQIAGLARISHEATRVDAFFGNPEFLASYLLFAIAATLFLASETGGRPLARVGLLGLAVLQATILVASGTRGAIVGLVAAVGACSIVIVMARGGRARVLGVAAMITTALAFSAAVWIRQTPALAQASPFSRIASIGAEALETRFALWRMALRGFQLRPSGWGQEGFSYVFDRFYDTSLAGQEPWFDRAHNAYLDTLVAGGAPALLLFIAFLCATAHGVWRTPGSLFGRIALIGGLIAYAVQALVVFDTLMTSVPLAAMAAFAHSSRFAPPAATSRARPVGGRIGAAASLPVIVSLVAVIWFVNVETLLASRNLIRALAPAGGGPLRLAVLKRAVEDPGFASQELCEALVKVAILVARSDARQTDREAFIAYAVRHARGQLARSPHEVRLRLQLARLYGAARERDRAQGEIALGLADAPLNPLLLRERDLLSKTSSDPSRVQ